MLLSVVAPFAVYWHSLVAAVAAAIPLAASAPPGAPPLPGHLVALAAGVYILGLAAKGNAYYRRRCYPLLLTVIDNFFNASLINRGVLLSGNPGTGKVSPLRPSALARAPSLLGHSLGGDCAAQWRFLWRCSMRSTRSLGSISR